MMNVVTKVVRDHKNKYTHTERHKKSKMTEQIQLIPNSCQVYQVFVSRQEGHQCLGSPDPHLLGLQI